MNIILFIVEQILKDNTDISSVTSYLAFSTMPTNNELMEALNEYQSIHYKDLTLPSLSIDDEFFNFEQDILEEPFSKFIEFENDNEVSAVVSMRVCSLKN